MADPDEPVDGGASSVESWDDEPSCTFDPDNGFAINERSLDMLHWYSYLSPADDGDETLLQSKNKE
jgi:hypothetical protein